MFLLTTLRLSTYRPSILRKAQDSIADPKYDGVRVSRKKLLEMEENASASGGEEDEGEEGLENDDQEFPGHSEDDEDSENEDEDEDEEEEEEEEGEEDEDEEEPPPKNKTEHQWRVKFK